MTGVRSSVLRSLLLGAVAAGLACGGEKAGGGTGGAVEKISITPTSDARADAKTYLAKLCPKPIGGELNFMVWEGYTDTLFAKPFEDACGVKMNATYMQSSDELVAKLRAGGAQTIDLVSPSSDAITQIIEANLAQPLDMKRLPSYGDLMASFRGLTMARKDSLVYGLPWAFGPNPLIYDTAKVKPAPDLVGRPVGQAVSRQAVAAGRYRDAVDGRADPGARRPERSQQAVQPLRRRPRQGQGEGARSSSPTSGSTGPPPAT